jgi:hypothetical protein
MNIPDEAVQAAIKAWLHEDIYADILEKWLDDEEHQEDMRSALTAALPFLQGVNVKALEWGKADDGTRDRAKTVVGWYFISNPKEGQYNLLFDNEEITALFAVYDTQEASKAAAQADYEARVMSAIEPAPSPRAQALEEAAQALEAWGDIYGDNAAKCVRALSSQPVADGWLPIETAPIGNGSNRFLAYITGHGPCVCYRNANGTVLSVDGRTILRATHWRPLPASPGASE